MNFFDRLTSALAEKGLSQADLARASGLAESTISRLGEAARPIPKCQQCGAQVWDATSEWSGSGCVIGVALLVFVVPVAFGVWFLISGIAAAGGRWWLVALVTVFMAMVGGAVMQQAFRRNHFNRCRGCGYSYPVK